MVASLLTSYRNASMAQDIDPFFMVSATPLTEEVYEDKISRIDATQIKLIGINIISQIVPHLGCVGKFRVEQSVLEKTGTTVAMLSSKQRMMIALQKMAADKAIIKENVKFLSAKDELRFYEAMIFPVTQAIAKAFSTPSSFLERGLCLQLSGNEPAEILKKACAVIGVNIDMRHVPKYYSITLCIDKGLSEDRSQLIFSIKGECEKVEFSNHTFALEELEKGVRSEGRAKL